MSLLCLAPLTIEPVTPAQHIHATAAAGFNAVALRLRSPGGVHMTPADPALPAEIPEMKRALRDSGLTLLHTTGLWSSETTQPADFLPALDASAELGPEFMVAAINDRDLPRARDHFAELCSFAAQRKIRIALEFLPYTAVRSLPEAASFITSSGTSNAGILIDALHLCRSGGSPADIAAIDPRLIAFTQLCDAPLRSPPADEIRVEARSRRLYPGDGELWLQELLEALPADIAIDIEAPCAADTHLTADEKARKAMAATRRFLDGYRAAAR